MRTLFHFGVAGVAATVTDFGLFNLGIAFTADPSHAHVLIINTAAFACATYVSYSLNSRFTFRATPDRARLLRYVLVAIGGAAVYDLALLAILQVVPLDDLLALNAAKAGAVAFSATWNFIGYSRFVFADRDPDTSAGA